jgi:type VII secretion protein EccE
MSTSSAARLATPAAVRTPHTKGGKRSGRAGGRIGLFRPVRIGQVALWELAILAVAGTVYPWRPVSIAVAAVAFVVIAMTSVRFAGLCAYQWIAVRLRFRRRPGTAKGTDPLAILLPGLRFRRQIDRAGNRAGLAELGDSLTAVVRLVPAANPDSAALLDVLQATFDRTDIRLAGAQLVVWSMPSPPRARYYGDQRDTEPMQVHWLALRYRAAEAPAATVARGGGDTGAARATATAALAMAGRLADAGYSAVVLDESELRQELLVALGSDHAALGGTAGTQCTVKETWQDWSIGTLRQITYLPKSEADGRAVLGRFVPQAAFTCTSYSLRRTARGAVHGESTVRIGMHPTTGVPALGQVSQAIGAPLLARNGRHGEACVGNLPLAAPLPAPPPQTTPRIAS